MNRATNAAERKEVLKRIEAAWEKTPGLRLGQLLANSHSGDLFYVEDFDLTAEVTDYANNHGKKQ